MRSRVLLALSVILNGGLLYFVLSLESNLPDMPVFPARKLLPPAPAGRTNVVLRRHYFTWDEIESADYRAYISNLREINCPEATIHDIIVAEVNQAYARKKLDITIPEQKWWTPDPASSVVQAVREQESALENQRKALLTELLGPGWESPEPDSILARNLLFDGPVLGAISPENKEAVQKIFMKDRAAVQEYTQAQTAAGTKPDPNILQQMEQAQRAELAVYLKPLELEEYMLRYSSLASGMRNELKNFGPAAEEFRAIFRAREAYEQQRRQYNLAPDSPQTAALAEARDAAIEQTLGRDRFSLYELAQNTALNEAAAQAQQLGATPEQALAYYQINQVTERELSKLARDRSLSDEDRGTAYTNIESARLSALKKLFGDQFEAASTEGGPPLPPGPPASVRTNTLPSLPPQ